MFANLWETIASVLVGGSVLFSSLLAPGNPPAPPTGDPAGVPAKAGQMQDGRQQAGGRRDPGDHLIRFNLVLATVSVTDLRPVEVLESLDQGESLAEIAHAAGSSSEDILDVFDETVAYVFQHRAGERLPDSLVESRIEWYQQIARLMVQQPGLKPSFPGLHELHVAIIAATTREAGLDREEVKEALQSCQTLAEVLEANGHQSQEALDLAMGWAGRRLDRAVAEGLLTEDARLLWEDFLQTSLEMMLQIPGLHLAGQECAE